MLIAWRDWVSDPLTTFAFLGIGTNATPASRLQDRRLAVKFVRTDAIGGTTAIEATFPEDRPVQLVSLLGHNIPNGGQARVTLKDASDATVASLPGTTTWQPPADSGIQRSWYARFSQAYSCRKVEIGLNTSAVFPGYDLEIGRFWASEYWSPQLDAMMGSFSTGVLDPSRVVESQGGQQYVVDRARRRTMRASLMLPESEAIGTAAAPDVNGQSLLFEAGNSGSVIVIPTTQGATAAQIEHLVHRIGIYGILQRTSGLELVNRATVSGENARLYRLNLDVLEQL